MCENCKKTFGALDADILLNPQTMLFHCDTCGSEVTASEGGSMAGQMGSIQSRLIEQTNGILRLLKRLDSIELAPFDPIAYLKHQEAFELVSPTATTLEDIVSSAEDAGAADRARRGELKLAGVDATAAEGGAPEVEIVASAASRTASKHEMPIWHTHSTVTGTQVVPPPAGATERAAGSLTRSLSEEASEYLSAADVARYYERTSARDQTVREDQEAGGPSKKGRVTAGEPSDDAKSTTPAATVPLVAVGGVMKRLDQIGEEDKDAMTEEEYSAYYEAFMSHGQA